MDRKKTSDRITLDIHGVCINVSTDSKDALQLLSDRLESYVYKARDDCEASVTIETTEPPVAPIDIQKTFTWVRSRPLWGDHMDGVFYLTDGASVAITSHEKRRAEIFIHPDTLGNILFASRTFLLLPILELLRTFGFFYVHGALLSKGEGGVLLLGHGGSGKSTLSAALLTKGWKIIGDDNLLFQIGPESFSIGFPFERELSIKEEIAHQLKLPVKSSGNGEKSRIRLAHLPQEMVAIQTQPNRIICLSKAQGDNVEPLDGSEVFALLLEENPLLLISPALARGHIETLRVLIRNARCQLLSLEKRPKIDLKEIANRFSELVGD